MYETNRLTYKNSINLIRLYKSQLILNLNLELQTDL